MISLEGDDTTNEPSSDVVSPVIILKVDFSTTKIVAKGMGWFEI